jgi:hypothetical protein
MGAAERATEPRAYRSFWSQVGRDFPSLKGAASTDYYFEGERIVFTQFFPQLAGRTAFKTDHHEHARTGLTGPHQTFARSVSMYLAEATQPVDLGGPQSREHLRKAGLDDRTLV